MKITKNSLNKNQEFLFFEKIPEEIRVEEWVNCSLIFLALEKKENISIICEWRKSTIFIYGLFASKGNKKLEISLFTDIKADEVSVNKHLISFLHDDGIAEVNADIHIFPGTKQVSGHLLEENIILGKNTKIKALPMLDIHSNDVKASHGVKIEKLNEEKSFYMQSRGLDLRQSQWLIIESYLNKILDNSELENNKEREEKVKEIKKTFKHYLLNI